MLENQESLQKNWTKTYLSKMSSTWPPDLRMVNISNFKRAIQKIALTSIFLVLKIESLAHFNPFFAYDYAFFINLNPK